MARWRPVKTRCDPSEEDRRLRPQPQDSWTPRLRPETHKNYSSNEGPVETAGTEETDDMSSYEWTWAAALICSCSTDMFFFTSWISFSSLGRGLRLYSSSFTFSTSQETDLLEERSWWFSVQTFNDEDWIWGNMTNAPAGRAAPSLTSSADWLGFCSHAERRTTELRTNLTGTWTS